MTSKKLLDAGGAKRNGFCRQAIWLGIALVVLLVCPACNGAGPTDPGSLNSSGNPDPAIVTELRAELTRILGEDPDVRSSSFLYSYEGEPVADAMLFEFGDGTRAVTWSYVINGDYDLNGEVSVSDITPIAIHFGKSSDDADWDSARVADGDGNGEINFSDITPIGTNYGSRIDGFGIHSEEVETGLWNLLAEVPFSEGEATGDRCWFKSLIADPTTENVLVIPLLVSDDGERFSQPEVLASFKGTIGPEGGKLELPDGTRLDIPEGELTGQVELTLSSLGGHEKLIDTDKVILDLSGAVLPNQYTITVQDEPGKDPATVSSFSFDPDIDEMDLDLPAHHPGVATPTVYDEETGMITISADHTGVSQTSRQTTYSAKRRREVVNTPNWRYFCAYNEKINDIPYYSQEHRGACGPACMAMMLKSQGSDVEVVDVIRALGFTDDVEATWFIRYGLYPSGNFGNLDVVLKYLLRASPAVVEIQTFDNSNCLLGYMLKMVDLGYPCMLVEPLHVETIIGYKKVLGAGLFDPDTYIFYTHDPKDDYSPASEGKIHTERKFEDLTALWGYSPRFINVYTVISLKSQSITHDLDLLTTEAPYLGSGNGYLKFITNKPTSGSPNYPIKLEWKATSETGYTFTSGWYEFGRPTCSPIPNSIDRIEFSLPVWNADNVTHDARLYWNIPALNTNPPHTYLFGYKTVQIPAYSRQLVNFVVEDDDPALNTLGSSVDRLVGYWAETHGRVRDEPLLLKCYLSDGTSAIDGFDISVLIQDVPQITYIDSQPLKPGAKVKIYGEDFGREPTDLGLRYVSFKTTETGDPLIKAGIVGWTQHLITCNVPTGLFQYDDKIAYCSVRVHNHKANSIEYIAEVVSKQDN